MPGVIYGPGVEGEKALAIVVKNMDFIKTFRKGGTSTLIDLKRGEEEFEVLIKSWQKDPVSGNLLSVDFFAIKRGEKMNATIPFVFVGESPAVVEGGILNTPVEEVEVSVMPKDLVSEFEVDISGLDDFEKTVTLADVKIDAEKFELVGVENPAEVMLASVDEPKEEEIEEEAPEQEETEVTEQSEEEGGDGEEGEKKKDGGDEKKEEKKEEGKE